MSIRIEITNDSTVNEDDLILMIIIRVLKLLEAWKENRDIDRIFDNEDGLQDDNFYNLD